MTTIYVNGKKVKKEDLKNIEIKNEQVKRILSACLSKQKEGV